MRYRTITYRKLCDKKATSRKEGRMIFRLFVVVLTATLVLAPAAWARIGPLLI